MARSAQKRKQNSSRVRAGKHCPALTWMRSQPEMPANPKSKSYARKRLAAIETRERIAAWEKETGNRGVVQLYRHY